MNDRMAAGLVLFGAGVALALWYYRLDRDGRERVFAVFHGGPPHG